MINRIRVDIMRETDIKIKKTNRQNEQKYRVGIRRETGKKWKCDRQNAKKDQTDVNLIGISWLYLVRPNISSNPALWQELAESTNQIWIYIRRPRLEYLNISLLWLWLIDWFGFNAYFKKKISHITATSSTSHVCCGFFTPVLHKNYFPGNWYIFHIYC